MFLRGSQHVSCLSVLRTFKAELIFFFEEQLRFVRFAVTQIAAELSQIT
jgi:hypothetical protein